MRYFMLNKPPGCITARRDFAGRPTVYDHVPTHFPELPHVGRLDWGTEGLLLFTDDGRLAQGLLNPGFKGRADPSAVPPVEKLYRVKVRDRLDPQDPRIVRLEQPFRYRSGVVTRPACARFVEHRTRASWLELRIREGRHRQVRMLCARSGFDVLKLRRVAVGPLELGDLRLRWCRPLTEEEVSKLYAAALPLDPRPSWEPIDDCQQARDRRPLVRE
ncbi:MAG: pseudouridine synthase [Myxococcota bacterium]|nr:pseudouridine synthase [Myxococcota bacterium]